MPTLQHLVFVNLNDKFGDAEIAGINEIYKGIVKNIEGMICGEITKVEYADKFATANKPGFTHCIVCLFETLEALDHYYNNSPGHNKLKGMAGQFLAGPPEDNMVEVDSWTDQLPSNIGALITESAQNAMEEKAEEKSNDNKTTNPLEEELAALKVKYGILKWKEIEQNGYPQPRRDENVVEIYKNAKMEEIKVSDAYRWLEDPDSAETREWINEQVDICGAYLSKCGGVKEIYDTIMENQNFPRFGTPNRKGEDPVIYYYAHNSGLQNQSVLYVHEGSLDAPRKCLLDPNILSDDGTTSAKGYYFSDNAKYLCYGLSKAGSDWREFHVKVE